MVFNVNISILHQIHRIICRLSRSKNVQPENGCQQREEDVDGNKVIELIPIFYAAKIVIVSLFVIHKR